MGILGTILGRREPAVEYRTIDGGHPAPFPDMTDEQLYNYEMTFNVARKTFDKPPKSARAAPAEKTRSVPRSATREETTMRREPELETESPGDRKQEQIFDAPRYTARSRYQAFDEPAPETHQEQTEEEPQEQYQQRDQEKTILRQTDLSPLDFSKPVRLVTTKQPVEIITTRARHPIYKVHGYIGNDDVVTVFTLDGQLSENGLRYLENVPQRQKVYLNIYPNLGPDKKEQFVITQHASQEQADQEAKPGRIACVPLEFDLF